MGNVLQLVTPSDAVQLVSSVQVDDDDDDWHAQ
eukprot:CAMPEP_0198512178 /NCGR_PEP_ID=MMETSP1462-20131121/15278_1 /TAXON_ID=1333877 /ORGANISM="Brandtodinium nutriculum, Strain RCC3387" /LENGTH=32 /DNA_ID= /DNA_START= /DNA_END= /DNA_ORIENTATION=